MKPSTPRNFPSAAVKVRLLQDAIYSDDIELWETLLRYQSPHIETYFQELGLQLIVHEQDGFAYLKQVEQEDGTAIPRLFRRDKLAKGVAIVGVILRERLLSAEHSLCDRLVETGMLLEQERIPNAYSKPRLSLAICSATEFPMIG